MSKALSEKGSDRPEFKEQGLRSLGGVCERRDPSATDWAAVELPKSWPDTTEGSALKRAWRLLSHPFRRRSKVRLPEGVPGAALIPKYALLEFHHLPNGNYSSSLTRGYIRGFEFTMLGELGRVRDRIASLLAPHESVLDVGCGGGRLVRLLSRRGHRDVWGLDPSPYMLKHAAGGAPAGRFIQGILEDIPFPPARFHAVTLSFVLHEIPPRYIRQGLAEVARVLKPGGSLMVAEPSPAHFYARFFEAIRRFGWRGAYFWIVSRSVHEPFAKAWHEFDLVAEAAEHGLVAETVDEGMPIKFWHLRKAGM